MSEATLSKTQVDDHDHHSHDHHDHHEESFFHKYFYSLDHKMIGKQYLWTGLAMALIGAFMVFVFRMQLAFPGAKVLGFGIVTQANYNALVTNHGTIMIFWFAMPVLIAAFGNFLIPLMIGCDDMVFPRINRLSYQVFLLSTIVLIASFLVPGGGFGGAWTSYPPLSAKSEYSLTSLGSSLWLLAVALVFAGTRGSALALAFASMSHSIPARDTIPRYPGGGQVSDTKK